MALIDCYECGKRISDEAPYCPKCGAKAKMRWTFGQRLQLLIVILFVVFFGYWFYWENLRALT